MQNANGNLYFRTSSSKPEDVHETIYKELGIEDLLHKVVTRFSEKI
jgi:hypothetical protein